MKEMLKIFLVPVTIIIAAALIGKSIITSAYIIGGFVRTQGGTAQQASDALAQMLKARNPGAIAPAAHDAGSEAAGSKLVKGVTGGTNPPKGAVNAPVVMVEFSDFQCPFTKRFFQQSFAQLNKEYIATGKVRFFFRDLPLTSMHPLAKPAAQAARAAGMQGKYWEMFDKLLQGDSLDQEAFNQYARDLGLNTATFQKNMNDPAVIQAVENDLKDASTFGATGTPAFFINGRFISGAYPYEVFQRIINDELGKQVKKK